MKFTLATCVRNEGPYLLEWVAHYKLLGFDRIVIFSNDNDDGSDALLAALAKAALIEWRPRTLAAGESPQLSAFRSLSKELFKNPDTLEDYLCWFDCDEFLILKEHSCVQDLLAHFNYPDALFINWKHFGSAKQAAYQQDLTLSRFTECDSTTAHNKFGKSISRLNPNLYAFISNHRPIPKANDVWGRVIYASDQKQDVPVAKEVVYGNHPKKDNESPIFHSVCQLNHYAIRSQEEYQWKAMRGNGRLALSDDKKQFRDSYFKEHNLNSETETFAMDKYASAIKRYIAYLPDDLKTLNDETITKLTRYYRTEFNINTHKPKVIAVPSNWLTQTDQEQKLRDYPVESIEKRLAYGSFVGDRLNYVFMETPKAACSTMKWILSELENRTVEQKQVGKESNPAMVIHLRASHGIKNLMQIAPKQRLKLLQENNVVRFCVVRNPYARLASAWSDKIRQKEPGYERNWQLIANYTGTDPSQCPSFQNFVRWVVETQNPKNCNPHWRPMANLLLPELIDYTHILHTESLANDLQNILNLIAPENNASILLKKYRTNESLPTEWQSYYDTETASLVADFFAEDFIQFDYSLNSWQAQEQSLTLAEQIDSLHKKIAKLEHAALNAIRSRNDIIFELIQKKHTKSPQSAATPIKNTIQKSILVLGDSHVNIFKRPFWSKTTPQYKWDIVSVEGATLSGLENPNSKTQAGSKFQQVLSETEANLIVLCLGEVDAGFVIWYRAEKNNIQIEEAAQRAVENYCKLIESAKSKAPIIVISTPLPTLIDGSTEGAIARARAEVKATLQQRTALTLWFNKQIQLWCQRHNIEYVNLDDASTDSNGLVKKNLRHPNPRDHHYNPVQYRKLLAKYFIPLLKQKLQ